MAARAPAAGGGDKGPLAGRIVERRYELIERIGQGGMGTVYRATHIDLNRRVAVKILNPELVADPVASGRFRREARILGAISHPNAVSVTDFGVTEEGLAYLVMELLEGPTLRAIVREGPVSLARAVRILRQVCGAVTEAHQRGVIHRDLKPDNIMLVGPEGEGETAKVLDFGIAKLKTTGTLSGRLTAKDTVVGTPNYLAPEACERGTFTPSTDVYALGIMLYEMLTGRPPFEGDTALDVAVAHVNDPPPSICAVRDDVTDEMEGVVFRALAKRPEYRQASAVEFADQFAATVRGSTNSSSRVTNEMIRPASLAPGHAPARDRLHAADPFPPTQGIAPRTLEDEIPTLASAPLPVGLPVEPAPDPKLQPEPAYAPYAVPPGSDTPVIPRPIFAAPPAAPPSPGMLSIPAIAALCLAGMVLGLALFAFVVWIVLPLMRHPAPQPAPPGHTIELPPPSSAPAGSGAAPYGAAVLSGILCERAG